MSDPRQLSRRVFEGIALCRGLPQEETDAAVEEAVERGDDALYRWDERWPGGAPDRRGKQVYEAVLLVINAVQERRYVSSGFESSRDATAPPTDDDAELPPTKGEVEAAKRHLDSLSMPRPMYRGDWVRINGGRGPTVAQARAEAQFRGEARSEIARARAEYERLNSAWEATRQDAGR